METSNLLGEDFTSAIPIQNETAGEEEKELSNVALLELNLSTNTDLLKDFMPSRLIHEGNFNFDRPDADSPSNLEATNNTKGVTKKSKTNEKTEAQVSWLSLFKELDPLANQDDASLSNGGLGDRL